MKAPASKLLVMAALALATDASAAAQPDTRSISVRYDDIDLSDPAQVEQLRSRLRSAARKVCDETGVGAFWVLDRVPECVQEAVDDALAQVRWPSG